MTDSESGNFSLVLNRYARYLVGPGDRRSLLVLGQRLFAKQKSSPPTRASADLLQAKEEELRLPPLHGSQLSQVGRVKSVLVRSEPAPLPPDQLAEDIMLVQDRNAVLLARCKALERQRKAMASEYGALMETSIQHKVRYRYEVQKLNDELAAALTRSRRRGSVAESRSSAGLAAIQELTELNDAVIGRVLQFKMAVARTQAPHQLTVMQRYKAEMERLLGQIYAYTDSLPVAAVIDKYNSISDGIEKELGMLESEGRNEHERNELLQREATQLKTELAMQQKEVDQLRKQNAKRAASISMLKEIAIQEIARMKSKYENLVDTTSDESSLPTSARAMIVTDGTASRKIPRTPSGRDFIRRDAAMPMVKPVQEFIAEHQSWLQDRMIQLRTVCQ
jgi:hypothetical protein